MKVCVFGAGAVGGHIAVRLALAGVEPSLVVRGAQLAAIRERGLVLRGDEGETRVTLRASDAAAELGAQDAVLVTLKSWALSAAVPALLPLLKPETTVVFLQNGIPWWYYHGHGGADEGRRLLEIDPGGRLWDEIGPQRVLGGITSSACTLAAPGVVEVHGGQRPVVLGEPDGSDSPRLRALAALLREAGFPVEATPRIRDRIWDKLALNLGSGPMAVLASVPLRELYRHPALVDARLRIQQEVAAIAQAMGQRVEIDAAAQLAFARRSPHVPSIGQDALAGRRIELETMFLEPLRMARRYGVATPTLDLLVALAALRVGSSAIG